MDVMTQDGDGLRILSPEEEQFCELLVASRYGAYAYRVAFDQYSTTTGTKHHRAAAKLAGDPAVIKRCDELRTVMLARTSTTLEECLANWLTIANADPDELIGIRVGCCRYCYGQGNRYQWREREYLDLVEETDRALRRGTDPAAEYPDIKGGFGFDHTRDPSDDCPECRGEGESRVVSRDTSRLSPAARMLFGGVKQTRNGLEIVMADRVKALENVTRMLGGFKDGVDLKTNGPLVQMVQAVMNQVTDPQEAGRLYEQMIRRQT